MAVTAQDPVKLSQNWGNVKFSDYKMDGVSVDFQDLMVEVSQKRAVTVEGEVAPLTARIRIRNSELDKLGGLLAIFTKTQSEFDSDAKGSDSKPVSGIVAEQWQMLREARIKTGEADPGASWNSGWANSNWSKKSVEAMISAIKSMIDARNNAAQTDMSRLQSLVDRRDESYSTASTLMTSVSDTRSSLIKNL